MKQPLLTSCGTGCKHIAQFGVNQIKRFQETVGRTHVGRRIPFFWNILAHYMPAALEVLPSQEKQFQATKTSAIHIG